MFRDFITNLACWLFSLMGPEDVILLMAKTEERDDALIVYLHYPADVVGGRGNGKIALVCMQFQDGRKLLAPEKHDLPLNVERYWPGT